MFRVSKPASLQKEFSKENNGSFSQLGKKPRLIGARRVLDPFTLEISNSHNSLSENPPLIVAIVEN